MIRILPITSLAFLLAAWHSAPTPALPGKITGALETGFDTFTEKYSVVEEDTVDSIVELRTRVRLSYLKGSIFKDLFRIEGQTLTGNNSIEATGRINLVQSLGSLRLGLESYLTSKNFWKNTSYAYANDYIRYNTKTFLQLDLNPSNALRITESFEGMDFERRNEFDYDYFKNIIFVDWDFQSSFSTFFHTGFAAAIKSIPDTSSISYTSYSASFDFRKQHGLRKMYSLAATGEWRSYAHKPTRSPYWSLFTYFNARPLVMGSWAVFLENTQESYFYDTSTDVYFNYSENRSALLFMYYHSLFFETGTGPMFAFLSSKHSQEDRYKEVGGKAVFEFSHAGSFWLSTGYEFGKRYYEYFKTNPGQSIFSDYFFNRFSFLANTKIWQNTGVNVFVSHEPQNHQRAGDDTSTTLLSVNLTYDF